MNLLPQLDKNYLTVNGDVLDKVCWLFYGQSNSTTEAVLARNPFLTRYPSVLPAGLILVLPRLTFEAQRQPLWDYVQPRVADLSIFDAQKQSYLDALEQYRLTKNNVIYVGAAVDRLYAPNSSVQPILVGDQVPPVFTTPPLPSPPSGQEANYVAVYYRGTDNVFQVGFVTREEFDAGAADEVLISGRP